MTGLLESQMGKDRIHFQLSTVDSELPSLIANDMHSREKSSPWKQSTYEILIANEFHSCATRQNAFSSASQRAASTLSKARLQLPGRSCGAGRPTSGFCISMGSIMERSAIHTRQEKAAPAIVSQNYVTITAKLDFNLTPPNPTTSQFLIDNFCVPFPSHRTPASSIEPLASRTNRPYFAFFNFSVPFRSVSQRHFLAHTEHSRLSTIRSRLPCLIANDMHSREKSSPWKQSTYEILIANEFRSRATRQSAFSSASSASKRAALTLGAAEGLASTGHCSVTTVHSLIGGYHA
ncbi:MAG TPA: hypothetical protein VJN21_13345 [Candidatus Acidoferrales bacterium]|nr:hypothetical protein [Candidatus Acidoferrales bacterium]